MLVECYDQKGAEVYELIVRQILQDLQITRSVKDMRVFVDPREPVFIIAIKVEKTASPLAFEDLAEYEYDAEEDKATIRIKEETYLPNLLEKLWELEGRDRISQPSRFEVVIYNPTTKLDGMIIYDPAENLRRKIYDAIFRILPEGFRVIRDLSDGEIVAMTCTDELMKEEWVDKCREMIEDLKTAKPY
jgi:putative methanogenesis marker protein 17